MLDRAHWILREGRGEFANDYAHAIQNIKDWGAWGNGFSENPIYNLLVDDKYSGKAQFYSGNTGYTNYDDFAKGRKNLETLKDLEN
jgi:hypothetical protein